MEGDIVKLRNKTYICINPDGYFTAECPAGTLLKIAHLVHSPFRVVSVQFEALNNSNTHHTYYARYGYPLYANTCWWKKVGHEQE